MFLIITKDYKVIDYVEFGIDTLGYTPALNEQTSIIYSDNKITITYFEQYFYNKRSLEYPYSPKYDIN